jgi:DNA helicase-2/ATP-dependent DNA helicase PcrA
MKDLLEGLNRAQREAVTHDRGPLLIIAGAGTGKTKVITHRIAHLISEKKARPEEILAVTFTEKAASEMEERVDLLVPYGYSFAEISTFNSFGERVLRDYGLELGFPPDFLLLDEVEQAIFFREHLFQVTLKEYRPLSSPTRYIQELLDAIKRLKQEDISPEEYAAYAARLEKGAADEGEKELASKHGEVSRVYREYRDLLRQEGKIDFEDQVSLVLELFRTKPSVLKYYQERYRYILVDEFQDTNHIQFQMLKLLAERHRNLTVVGDDDQSIFRFRGASLSNILTFREIYPDFKKIVLTQNYRSTQDILDTAYRLIQMNNPDRLEVREKIDKRLESDIAVEGKSIHMLQFDSLSHEADRVSAIIKERHREGIPLGQMAVLVRRNADADPFLRALNMKEIPFRFSGSRGLYQQEEIRLLVAFIRALTDFEDSKALFYLAQSAVYGLDAYDLTLMNNFAHKKNLPLHKVFRLVSQGRDKLDISGESRNRVSSLFKALVDFVRLAGEKNAGQLLYLFLEGSGYLKDLVARGDAEAELRIKNIRIFFEKVRGFSQLTDEDSIFAFAGYLDLLQQVGDNPATAEAELEEDAVQVLTVHKAKGLEFRVVFLVDLIADRFPGRERRERIPVPDELLKENLPSGEKTIQEERRLFYVALTRARHYLYLTWARDHGLKRLKKVSPFVLEALDLPSIPENVIRASALEDINRYAPRAEQPSGRVSIREAGPLRLSFYHLEAYLTCPLKYRFRHILRIPVLPNHNLVFGRVIHSALHFYLKSRMAGRPVNEEDLLEELDKRWVNEGFLSREHEELRKKAGVEAVRRYRDRQERSGSLPRFLEKKFLWREGEVWVTGRWDRVDLEAGGAVIIDFKTTEVKDRKTADKKTRESLQMDLYALAFERTQDVPVAETRLHFLESDIIGRAEKGEREMARALMCIEEVAEGIRSGDFRARPDWHNCSYCEYRTICPYSFAY